MILKSTEQPQLHCLNSADWFIAKLEHGVQAQLFEYLITINPWRASFALPLNNEPHAHWLSASAKLKPGFWPCTGSVSQGLVRHVENHQGQWVRLETLYPMPNFLNIHPKSTSSNTRQAPILPHNIDVQNQNPSDQNGSWSPDHERATLWR